MFINSKSNGDLPLLDGIINSNEDAILIIDNKGQIIGFNKKLTQLWQIKIKDLPLLSIKKLISIIAKRVVNNTVIADTLYNLSAGHPTTMHDIITLDDETQIAFNCQPYYDGKKFSGSIFYFKYLKNAKIPTTLPITADAAISSSMSSLSLLKATLESTADGILVVDIDGRIISYNQKFRKMWKIPRKMLEDHDDTRAIQYVLRGLKDSQGFIAKLTELYSRPHLTCFDEFEFADGRTFERYSIPQRIGKKIVGRVFSFRDVTLRKKMEQELIYTATHDELTGLPNRTLLLDRIEQSISYASRYRRNIAVVFIDIDRFKGVNDSLGHDTGDALLKIVTQRLQDCTRASDSIARWGGDEFAVVLSDLDNEESAIPFLQRCQEILKEPVNINGHSIVVSLSMGLCYYPRDGNTPMSLLKNADSAMYHAKNEGRNNYQFYQQQMTDMAVENMELENDLHQALQKNQLHVYYQPIVDLHTGGIKGAEALLRWNHPERGFINPEKFIKVAEEAGMIIAIGTWVLRQACLQVKKWQDEGLKSMFISINVSACQLRDVMFMDILEKVLAETQIDPYCVELEITETSLISNLKSLLPLLVKLKEKGISLSVDDFGTGYSSLHYLHVLPVDKLKIDKSFVQENISGKNSIILSIISLAKALDLRIIAEGIETPAQHQFLKDNHCEAGQGFLFHRPMPAEMFAKIMQKTPQLQFFNA